MAAERVTGVILAGGQATRFGGQPKGLELVGHARIIDRVAGALRAVADELLLVANQPEASTWLPGIRTVSDVRPGFGSLGGIYSALVHASQPVLIVAWDMPFVGPSVLDELRTAGADADVVVFESRSTRGVEPLCAFYRPTCIAPIERHMDGGDLRVVGFFESVRVVRLPPPADPDKTFMNVNTPSDLALAEGLATGQITG
ncbi:MAG TPA: molybdenum cofactor guanylyltransferase [Gemmatimonadaceae bacterium]|nr:molybdenum cofactor guanylyltransferase [Gemmatimonadaceae bacterium]